MGNLSTSLVPMDCWLFMTWMGWQMCVATLNEIRYSAVLLSIAFMGFGCAFYVLFREDAAAASLQADGKNTDG